MCFYFITSVWFSYRLKSIVHPLNLPLIFEYVLLCFSSVCRVFCIVAIFSLRTPFWSKILRVVMSWVRKIQLITYIKDSITSWDISVVDSSNRSDTLSSLLSEEDCWYFSPAFTSPLTIMPIFFNFFVAPNAFILSSEHRSLTIASSSPQ